jgi:hypothetical protein
MFIRIFLAALFSAWMLAAATYERAQQLAGRVQSDLQKAVDYYRNSEPEKAPYEVVQRDVAAFQNQLQKGKFDKDKLAIVLGDLKTIHLSNNNTLDARDREALGRDLTDLQALRSTD